MANSKISALTSATTPVAGTEPLPIVQGGVTKQVSIANLTAGRAVSASSFTASNLTAGRVPYVGTSGLIQDSTNFTYVDGSALTLTNANFKISDGNRIILGSADPQIFGDAGVIKFRTSSTDRIGINTAALYPLSSGGMDLGTSSLPWGNLYFSNNLVQGTAAKGINFTANSAAAGMTSQLLNWYEEGNWTPNQGSGLTVVGAFSSSGKYTRIGRQVTVQGSVSGATSVAIAATASQICSNLPYSSSPAYSGSMFNAAVAGFGGVAASANIVYATSTMAATTTITFSVTYTV